MTDQWSDILRPRLVSCEPVPRSRSGGVSLTGQEQTVTSDAGVWGIRYVDIPIRRADQVRVYRAIAARLNGRAGSILVPVYDCRQTPWPVVAGKRVTSYGSLSHSDGSLFSDRSGYRQPVIVAYLAAEAALRATTLTVGISYGAALQGGEHFSIGERLYRIASVQPGMGGLVTVQVWPPLREAAPAGAALEFDRPVCRMRLASDDAMPLDLDLGRFAGPTVSFVEALG